MYQKIEHIFGKNDNNSTIDNRKNVRYNQIITNMRSGRRFLIMTMIREFIVKHMKFSIAVFVLIVTLTVLVFGKNKALGSYGYDKQCVSIEIEEGDTLWSIAKSYYVPECGSIREYIDEIKKANRLCTDDIHAGCYLIVPYYVPVH